jgi:uncharacterized protein (DUF1684 family)
MAYSITKKFGLFVVLGFCFFQTIGQSDDTAFHEINEHRKKQQEKFRNRKESPLGNKERRHFKGLNYYPIDLAYRVKVKFVKTENPVHFKMKTTTSRLPEYSKYGDVYFSLQGVDYKLEVYQSPDIMKRPGYEDYLFIPFTDETNGHETYDVGRYLEFRIPTSDDIILDFNQCYNPYCSYSPNYSCPVPPEVNYLATEVKAGEKKFKTEVH